MCVLELDENYFIQEISNLVLIPETAQVICVSISMAGWISVVGYRLASNGQLVFPNASGVTNAYWLGVTGNTPAPLPLDAEKEGFIVEPEPVFELRALGHYIAYICPFDDEIKVETLTQGPSAFLLNPTLNAEGLFDRFIEDLNDEGDDSQLVNNLMAMVDRWDCHEPGV